MVNDSYSSLISSNGQNLYLSFLPIFGTGCGIIIILWILLIYKLFIRSQYEFKHEFVYNFYRILTLICYSCCVGCAIGDTFHLYICWKRKYLLLGGQLKWIKSCADFCFFTASATLTIILFGRVYYTFRSSYFSLSLFTIIFFSFQIISSIILDLTYCVLVTVYGSDETLTDYYAKPLVIAIVCNDLTVSISMIYLFSYKLKEIVVMSNAATYHHNNIYNNIANCNTKNNIKFKNETENFRKFKDASSFHDNDNDNDSNRSTDNHDNDESFTSELITHRRRDSDTIQLDTNQLSTIVVVVRHSILSGFAIFFNQIYYEIAYISMRSKWEHSYELGLLVYGLRMIGMIGVMISLYFSMRFAKKLYFKCCVCCHLTCYRCCIRMTRRNIKHKILSRKH